MLKVAKALASGSFIESSECVLAAFALAIPGANHSSEHIASVDRFFVHRNCVNAINDAANDAVLAAGGFGPDLTFNRPLSSFWLEMEVRGRSFGFLCQPDRFELFMIEKGVAVHILTVFLQEKSGAIWAEYFVPSSRFDLGPEGNYAAIAMFVGFCVAATQPNVADVRRVVPGSTSRAERKAVQRAMQRGRPMFSYNVVTMKCGRTSRHGGEVCGDNPRAGVRAHWRTGHWRLIVPVERPAYFTWIDATECGDPERGRVVKERHVEFAVPSEVRRGFLVPDFEGRTGVRVPAKEVA